jgi:hypothetical protein
LSGKTYTATVSGAQDSSGASMAAPLSWSFTTNAVISNATIWSSSVAPAISSVNDPNAVELGLQFKPDVNGKITGIKFYKGAGNIGTHIGHLWTSDGQLLASVTFTNETSGGWQQADLSTAVNVTKGTQYVVSYWAPNGNYAATGAYFANGPVDTGTLTAINGVYLYGSDAFPNQMYNNNNYWVDVVFTST